MVEGKIPLSVQIKSVEREIAMRKAVYPTRVAAKKMKQETADHELAAMEAVLGTLKRLEWESYACPDNCDHTIAEHEAFDAGVDAGERGEDEEAGPRGPISLRNAWLTGHSVGLINRERSDESTTANNRD
jgi:hypothetical protein